MIHNVFVVGENGVCLYNKNLQAIPKNNPLEKLGNDLHSTTSFLMAISFFSKESVGEPIKSIITENYKFIFTFDKKFLFAILVDKSDAERNSRLLLKVIKRAFHENFPDANFEYQRGNLKYFSTFTEPLTALLKSTV